MVILHVWRRLNLNVDEESERNRRHVSRRGMLKASVSAGLAATTSGFRRDNGIGYSISFDDRPVL
jgi:hypothetical protein